MNTVPQTPSADGVVRLERTALGDTLVLDRPARRNALTLSMWQQLAALVREHGVDTGTPLYVVGSGGYFCSGADLDALAWARSDPAHSRTFVHAVVGCLLTLHSVEREVVAVVEHGAAGGGVEIMAACDRRVAIGAPTLVFPFGHHGMTLDGFTRWGLHRLVGGAEAERLVDGRHVVDFARAREVGLFDEQHETVEDLTAAGQTRAGGTHPRPEAATYLTGDETLEDAVARAAAPMLASFAPPA